MARLPEPNGDDGVWGSLLNDFLQVELNQDGTLKRASDIAAAQATADSKYLKPEAGIPEGDLDSEVQDKLNNVLAHSHAINDVTGLQAALDSKAPNGSTGATTLNALTDVNTTGAAEGNALVYQGGEWSPAAISTNNPGGSIPDDNSVTSAKIVTSAVGNDELAPNAVTNEKILNGTISKVKLSTAVQNQLDAIASAVPADNSIMNVKIASDAEISQTKIAGLVAALNAKATTSSLTSGLATKAASSHNHAGSDINSGIVGVARLGSGVPSTSTYLRGDGTWAAITSSGTPTMGGDITGTTSAAVIATGAVTSAKILDGTIVNGDINANAQIAQTKILDLVDNLTAKTAKSTLTTKGDLYVASGASAPARLAVGTNNQVLTADSSATNGVKWAATLGQPLSLAVGANVPAGTAPTFIIRT